MGDCYDSDCDGSSMSVEKFLNIMDEIPDTSQDDNVNRNFLMGINNSFCHDGTNVSSVPNGFQDSEVSSYETHLMSSSFSLSHKLPPTNEYPGYFLVGDYPGNLNLLSQQSSKITSEIRSCTSRSSQDSKAYVDGMSDQMEEDNVNCERSGKPTYCIATSMKTSNGVALSSRKYTHLQSSMDDDDILVASNRSVLGWDISQLDTSCSDALCIDIDDTVYTAEEESHHDPVIVEQPKVDHSEEVKATPISSNVEFSAMTCNASCIGEGQSASAKITDNHEDLNRESSFRTFFGSNHLAKNHEASNFSRATAHEAPSFDEGSHFLDECAAKQNYMKNVTRASNSSCEGVCQSTLAKLTVHEVMKCEAPVGLSLGFHSRAEILAHEIPNFNKVLHVENASKPSMAGIQQNCLSYGTKDTISSYDGVHQFALDKATTNLEDMKCDTLFLTPMGYRSQTKAHEGSNGSNFPGKIFSKAPVAVIKNCMKDEPHAGNSSCDMLHKAMQGNITVIEDMKIEAKFPPYQGCHSQVKAHELPNFTKEFKFHDGNFSKPHIPVIQKNCMKNETQASNSLCDGVCQSTRAMLTVNLEEMEYGKAFSPSRDCKLQGKAYEVTKFNQGHHFRNKNALKTPISVIQQNQMKNQTKSCRVFNKKGDAHVQDTNSGLITESLRLGLSYDDSHDVCIIEDNDICVLEDMSQPASCNPCRNTINPAQRISSLPSVGGIRLKTNEERSILRFALQDLTQPKSESSPPDGSLSVSLLRHQRIALSWMVQKETCGWNCSGGILADDQGLGKTVSTIALILKERSPTSGNGQGVMKQCKLETLDLEGDNDAVTKHSVPCDAEALAKPKGRPSAGTLIVCPTSVLQQWDEELHRKVTSEANLSVHVYHGPNRTKDPYELSKYDVVLTTYSIVTMEVPKQPSVNEDYSESPSSSFPHVSPCKKRKPEASNTGRRPSKGHRGVGGSFIDLYARPLAKVGWFRVVLDEAQSIKNHRTHVARACWGLRAKRRWCLSGTPIQNTVDDLYSYLRFLRYDPFVTYKAFYSAIKAPISKCPENGYKMLQALLKTVMLRRTKGSFLDGKPIVALPPKSIELRKVDFSKEEREFYTKLEADSRAQFEVYAAAGTVKQNYVNILLMLLRLRQACDHPFLVNDYARTSAWKSSSLEAADRLPPEMQAHLLTVLEGSLAICSMCNDSPEDAVVAACGDVFCYQCVSEHLMGDNSACPNEKCRSPLSTSCIFSRDTLRASLRGNESDRSNPAETVPGSSVALSGESFDSAKIKAAAQVLEAISKPQPSGEKAIVFSQWARMLDLLERCLKRCSIQYRRLDGTMSVAARDRAVKDFNNIPEISVIIMSLKAASLGLNMVAACHVILLDLWWNPTTEDQAIDRAHRIGQTRPVTVLRLTVKDTVEDRILALQQKKREMVASAFGDDESSTLQSRLTVDDLKFLFTA